MIEIVSVPSGEYYGDSYEDVIHRVPKVEEAKRLLDWEPATDLRTALKHTLNFHLANVDYELNRMKIR